MPDPTQQPPAHQHPAPKHPAAAQRPADETAAKLHDLLATLWCRSQETIAERLAVVRASYQSLQKNAADRAARRSGADAAHKLAGILGTFGLPAGTELARQTEIALEADAPLTTAQLAGMGEVIQQLASMIDQKSRETGARRA
jgi:HPt (histidine-containing phosphotransfer) domain-containing protein